MKREAHLCVGGPCDGELRVVDGTSFVVIERVNDPEPRDPVIATRRIHYGLQRIAGDKEIFHVFTPAGMTGDELVLKLLKNYGARDREDHCRADHRHSAVGHG